MLKPIVPAIIPKSKEHLLEVLPRLSFSNEIQIDVVDGIFVDTISWPFSPVGEPLAIKHATDPYTLEVDLMVSKPTVAAIAWENAGADMLVFHVESISVDLLERYKSKSSASIGVAFHGDTSLDTFLEYTAIADYVQLMGIKEIGKQAEPFNTEVIENIKEVRRRCPDMMISIDGSVNMETIEQLAAAGADRFVAGSGILGTEDFEKAHAKLLKLVN